MRHPSSGAVCAAALSSCAYRALHFSRIKSLICKVSSLAPQPHLRSTSAVSQSIAMAGMMMIILLCTPILPVLGNVVSSLSSRTVTPLSYRPGSPLRPTSLATVTPSATLTCAPGSTAKVTTDCTYGHTYTFCYSPPATLVCTDGYYPSVNASGHCDLANACYLIPTTTTQCETNGFTVASTATLFNGVLNNGVSTRIESSVCGCSGQYSYFCTPYTSFCLPTGSCQNFLVAKTSSFSYTISGSVTTRTNINCYCPSSSTRKLLYRNVG